MQKNIQFKTISLHAILAAGFMVFCFAYFDAVAQETTDRLEKARDQTSAELEELQIQREASAKALERLKTKIATLKKDQDLLQVSLKEAEQKQTSLNARAQDSQERLAKLETDETAIKLSLRDRNDILSEVLAALQRLGSNPPPALLVKPEDALSSVRSAILLGAVVPEIRSETEKLLTDLQKLAEIRVSIDGERIELAEALEQSIEEEKKLTRLIQEKAALNVASLQQLEKEKVRVDELKSKSKDLELLVASIDEEVLSIRKNAEEARIAEIARQKRVAENLEKARDLARENTKDDKQLAPSYAFSELRDTVPFPVDGILAASFGDDDGTGEPLQGIALAASEEAEVKAPIDGWVVYSGPFRSYGKMLIINAGEGYHLVMSGLGNLNVSQGQFIVKGEPIATMGPRKQQDNKTFALASGKPTLYIELRKDQKTIDSAPWWADITSGRVSNDT
ncbi:peptidoglycan DD-metalloendopeptidase family protein [Lentilitoribacter sp. Alg239-R112]|jgi:septal ring factor EnvC (AmiA/AmiB activator)|uniref:murein hydrolase activator EnvC family protein n=1 Tax=Lentilitoribacter sp. Alg239-R112 TaxID=2305987 RepID=UPI0013A6CAB4|nr:peptidoglycan DD-metalloendopeptidase family protein [Lentilitoribacter sp. Alg239-R112]